jgi:hypothetical protein
VGIPDQFTNVVEAYTRWRKLMKAPANQNTCIRFWYFLGLKEDIPIRDFTEEAKRKVDWLNSPHYVTMFRAWEAQNAKVDS